LARLFFMFFIYTFIINIYYTNNIAMSTSIKFTPPLKLTFLLINIGFNLITSVLPAQVITGPGMHWSKDHWLGMETEPQSESGEDWYYDFIPYMEDETLDGYAGFGFRSYVNDNGDFECFNCGVGVISPEHLERYGYEVGCNYPKIAEMDKLGNIEWYEVYPKGFGAFRAGIQLKDESGYVGVGYLKFEGGNQIPYNPGIIGEGNELSLLDCDPDPVSTYNLLYIVRTDEEGEVQAEAVYGWETGGNANTAASQAYGIIQVSDDDNLVIIGYAFEGGLRKGYLMKIDKDDLSVIWRKTIIDAGPYSSIATALVEYEDYYYVAGTKNYATGIPGHGKINIVKFEPDGDFDENFEINYATTGDTDIDEHFEDCTETPLAISTCVAYKMVINDGDLLVASEIKRTDDVQGTKAEALGKVYRINLTGSMSWENTVSVVESPTDKLVTFDLKVGITNTYDGGYAITSSKHISDLYVECDDSENLTYYPGTTESFSYEWTRVWNADAYIAKFSSSDVMEWNATYPITDGYGTYFPDDIKQMECVYQIVEAPDHGLIVAGNNSKNFDDDLVIKTYNDCNRYVSYNTGAGDINVTGTNTISSNTTWNANKKVRGIIEIMDDATLTITSEAIIQFADSKADNIPTYILVKRGGRLVIEDEAILTGNAECGTMWEGIYVEGTYGTNHPTPASLIYNSYYVSDDKHGIVLISDGATIENARQGVTLGFSPASEDYPDYNGGILIANDANFINNSIDVFFWPFNKSNVSFMRNCNFSTNAILTDEIEKPIAHIEMIQVKGVSMRGNTFENLVSSTLYNGTDRGMGIYSLNSTFYANDNANAFGTTGSTSSDPNYFNDLYVGVYGAQYTTLSTNIVVDGNVFNDNGKGVYLGGTALAEVNRNTFNLPERSTYGLYIDASTGYGVEENIFTGSGADHPHSQAGLVINASGTASNMFYRNTFNDLKYASRIQGNNGNTTSGLVVKCNTYEDNKFDISLISGSTTATMNQNQGTCGGTTTPANNLFTDPTFTDLDNQIKTSSDINTGNYYKYTFHEDLFQLFTPFAAPAIYSNSIDPKPDGDVEETGCNTLSFNLEDWETVYCPTNFTSGGSGERMAAPGKIKPGRGNTMAQPFNKYLNAKTLGEDYTTFISDIQFNMLASYYMQQHDMDSLASIVDVNSGILAQSIKVQLALDEAQFETASTLVNNIAESETLLDEEYSIDLQNIAINLTQDTLTWLQLNQEQMDQINTLALKQTKEGIQAKLILELLTGVNYEEPINPLNEEFTEEELRDIKKIFPVPELNTITIYPHPVGNSSIVEINLEYIQPNTRFIITDMQGRYINSFPLRENNNYIKLNNSMLKSGVYIGYVSCTSCPALSKQIVVVN